MASKPSGDPPKDASDLAALWEGAVVAYKNRTGKDLQMAPFRSMEGVIRETDQELQAFGGYRHPDKSKIDKVRSAFTKNLESIKKVLISAQIASNVAAIFPPAMPATLIFSAFGFVLQSFSNVSADYDKVESFFNKTHRFLDRLSILEDKTPSQVPFQRCVTRIFSSQLEICAIAHEYTKEEHRFKKWLEALWDGTDKNLNGAFDNMENAIKELTQAMQFATYREARQGREEIQNLSGQFRGVQVKINTMSVDVKNFRQDVSAGFRNTSAGFHNVSAGLHNMSAHFHTIEGKIEEEMSLLLGQKEKASKVAQEAEKEKSKKSSQRTKKLDVGDKRYAALDSIRQYFSQSGHFFGWDSARMQNKAQVQEIRANFVPGTCTWFLSDDVHFKAWTKGEYPILWMNGSDGVGKSFIAYAAAEALSKTFDDQERKSVAYFYFRETYANLRSAKYGLASVAWQIADSDSKYCEQVAVNLKREIDSDSNDEGLWKRFFADRYPANSDGRLFLILDGLDELDEKERERLLKSLAQITEDHLNISVFLTSRPELRPVLEPLNPVVIEVTRTKLSSDITQLIKARCKSLPRLHKFPRRVQARIMKKVKSKADGMLYVEHMLRRLSYIGREDAVLKDLEQNLPDNLQSLYQLMLAECRKNRTEAQYKALKRLFAWLAFSKRPLTLSEATALVKITVPDGSFDLEDEIIGRSARLLDLARPYDEEGEADEDGKSIDSDQSHEEADLDVFDYGSTVLTFVERSLRDFFRALDVNEEGLRTSPSAAHLTIFDMAGSIMVNATQNNPIEDEGGLINYATSFWSDHFVEIDLSKATDHDVSNVLNTLYRIMSNINNVAGTLESHTFPGKTYPSYARPDGTSWLDYLLKWVERGASFEKGVLTTEVEEWIHCVATSPSELLLPLARGHVMNWYKVAEGRKIDTAFEFAKAALNARSDPTESPPGILEEIHKVTKTFDIVDIENHAGAKRAIATVLLNGGLPERAISYLIQSLKNMSPGNSSERFYTYWILVDAYGCLGKLDDAIKAVNEAIAALPSDWEEDNELIEAKKNILIYKAQYCAQLRQSEAAVETYNEARAVNPNQTIGGSELDDMTRVRNWDNDPTGSSLIEMLKNWTDQERLDWFDYLFKYHDDFSSDRFSQAATQCGTTGLKFLLDCYTDFKKTLRPGSSSMIFYQAQLADIYNKVIGDETKAKDLYNTILKTKIRDDDDGAGLEQKLCEVRLSLAGLIFTEFQGSSDPVRKMALLEEMKKLEEPDYDLYESHVGVLLAIMTRILGPAIEFQSHMEKTFQTCIEGLTDAVGWNDSISFRLLAKVLACLEGLEREALIGLSCQFSIMDPDTHPGDAGDTSVAGAAREIDGTDQKLNNISEKTVIITGVEQMKMPEVCTVMADTKGTMISITTTGTTNETSGSGEEDNAQIPNTNAHDINAGGVSEPDEDLNEMDTFTVHCDGECDTVLSTWTQEMYFCIMCPNIDLCAFCHSKRLARKRGDKSTYWRSYCGPDHCYIRGPIKDWRGVKNGVIRIGNEEISFKQWLKDLQEVKWKEAWERFWERQGGVKDIEG